MYPTLSDLIKDIFGLNVPLPIKMFGLFVAIAFLIALYLLKKELKRRENAGLLKPFQEVNLVGGTINAGEIFLTGFIALFLALAFLVFARLGFSFKNHPESGLTYFGITVIDVAIALIFALVVSFLSYHFKSLKPAVKPELKITTLWPHERTDTLIGIAVVAGIIGAKLFDGLENWSSYIAHPANFIAFSGLTFYGGLIVAAIAIMYYAHQKNIDKWQLADSAAPALMLAYGVGRIGCHMSGDGDWGIVNTFDKPVKWFPDWIWSYTYPHNVSDQGIPMPNCIGPHCFQLPQGVFPTSLYECIVCSLLFLVLWQMRKVITVHGQLFGIYLIMNGVERFLIELIRVNNTYDLGFIKPTQAELISLVTVMVGLAILVSGKNGSLSRKDEN